MYELNHASKKLATVAERVAQEYPEDEEEMTPLVLQPVTRTVAKPTNNEIKKKKAELEYYIEEIPKTDRDIRITQHNIVGLEVQGTKLEDLLQRPEIQFQTTVESQMRRLSGNPNPTPQESIRGEIVRINDQINEENKRLRELKDRLKAYEGFVDILEGLRT